MNWLSFAAVFVFTASLIEGVYIFSLKPRSPVNRRFFGMTLCLSVWLLGASFAYSGGTIGEVVFWFRVCSFGFIFLHAFTLHFCIGLSGLFRRRIWNLLAFLVYVPSVIFMYKSATGLIVFKEFVRAGRLWLGIPDYGSRTFLLLILNYAACYLASAVILIRWRALAEFNREKKQAFVILISIVGTIFLFNLEPFILPLITNYRTFAVSPIFSLFWITGIGYAIMKYRLLSWSPGMLSGVILDDIDEAVIVLDTQLRILYINSTGKGLLGGDVTTAADSGTSVETIVDNPGALMPDLQKLLSGELDSFSCMLYLKGAYRAYMDLKCSAVREDDDHVQGIAMVGRELKDTDNLKTVFSLSQKEAEVLRLLIEGKRIAEIGELLRIAPRTVKAHSAHIYSKLNVRNKMELFQVLKNYNLMPEHSAQSSTFPLLKKNPHKDKKS